MARRMTRIVNLDNSVTICACGAVFDNAHASIEEIRAWYAKHEPHCDEILETTSDDGARAWASKPPPELRPIRQPKEHADGTQTEVR